MFYNKKERKKVFQYVLILCLPLPLCKHLKIGFMQDHIQITVRQISWRMICHHYNHTPPLHLCTLPDFSTCLTSKARASSSVSETDGQTDGALSFAVQRHRKRTPILPARLSLSLKYTHTHRTQTNPSCFSAVGYRRKIAEVKSRGAHTEQVLFLLCFCNRTSDCGYSC